MKIAQEWQELVDNGTVSLRTAGGIVSKLSPEQLCQQGRISELEHFGRSWVIPKSAKKPQATRNLGKTGKETSDSKGKKEKM